MPTVKCPNNYCRFRLNNCFCSRGEIELDDMLACMSYVDWEEEEVCIL